MQTNKVIQSLPCRLLFYFASLLFLLVCGVAVVGGYLVGSVLLSPFTHNPIMIGSLAGPLLYFLFTGVMFGAFTYGVVMIEKSQNNFIFDHFRHAVFFYLLLIVIAFHEHAMLYQAFLSVADANNDDLITAIHTAQRTLTVLGTFAVVIVSNLIVLHSFIERPEPKRW